MNKQTNYVIDAEEFKNLYWAYFLDLEKSLAETQQYVQFAKENYKTYSFKFLQLYQTVCSEIDVISKAILSHIDNKKFDGKFNKNNYFLQTNFPNIINDKIKVIDIYELQPFKDYKMIEKKNKKNKIVYLQKNPKVKIDKWWSFYNDVKHIRTSFYNNTRTNYTKANLKNVLLAFSALFLLEFYFAEQTGCVEIIKESKLFKKI